MSAPRRSPEVPLDAELIALAIVPDVIAEGAMPTLGVAEPLAAAAVLLTAGTAEAVAVVDAGGAYVGLVSLRDVARAAAAGTLGAPVAEVMQPRRDWLAPDDTPLDALELFRARRVDHLPVLARETREDGAQEVERLIGIVSVSQLVRLLHRQFEYLSMQRQRRIFGLQVDD